MLGAGGGIRGRAGQRGQKGGREDREEVGEKEGLERDGLTLFCQLTPADLLRRSRLPPHMLAGQQCPLKLFSVLVALMNGN